jgi:hypothetical protein
MDARMSASWLRRSSAPALLAARSQPPPPLLRLPPPAPAVRAAASGSAKLTRTAAPRDGLPDGRTGELVRCGEWGAQRCGEWGPRCGEPGAGAAAAAEEMASAAP